MTRAGTTLCLLLVIVKLGACAPIEEKKPSQDAKYHYLMGASALNENNPSDALKEFLRAEEIDSNDPEIQAGLAEAYMRKRAYDLSEQHFKRALVLSNHEPKYYNNLGALYLNMERYDEAVTAFQTAAENLLFDKSEVAWTGVGFSYYQMQDYPAAERAYRKSIQVQPRYYQAYYRLGELYYAQQRPVEAADQFARSVELAPNFIEGHYWLGLAYMKIQQPAKAKTAFQEVVKLSPGHERARLARKYLDILK